MIADNQVGIYNATKYEKITETHISPGGCITEVYIVSIVKGIFLDKISYDMYNIK